MHAYRTTSERVVPTGAATNGDDPERSSGKGNSANGTSADRKQDADCTSTKRNETYGEAADGQEPAGEPSTGDPAGSDVT